MAVNFEELLEAFDFVSSGGQSHIEAFLHLQSGKICLRSPDLDIDDELPDDYRIRLADLGLDLPERIRGYAEHIMAAEPSYEELHKVFSLAESLARLDRIGISGARVRLDALSHRIREQAQVDARYDMVRAAIYGAGAPTWWEAGS
jgi:hypothetical protein